MSSTSFPRKYEMPLNLSQKEVFLNGQDKSIIWTSPPHYIPTWTELRSVRYNPRLTRRNPITHNVEDNWTELKRQRHLPSGYYGHPIGTQPSGVPGLKLNGYTRDIYGMPPRDVFLHTWPKADSWMPPARGPRGEYYGYYHEAIESERMMRDKLRPLHDRITPFDIPRITTLNCKQVHRDVDSVLASGLS